MTSFYRLTLLLFEGLSTHLDFNFTPLPLSGNHESECHDPACVVNPRKLGLPLSNFTAYNARWKMPSQESGGVASMWYR